MIDNIEFQTWICPVCHDDHSLNGECDREYALLRINTLKSKVKTYRQAILKLVEMGEFYGDNDSYRSKGGGHIENKSFHSKIGQDCGRLARSTLKELEGLIKEIRGIENE